MGLLGSILPSDEWDPLFPGAGVAPLGEGSIPFRGRSIPSLGRGLPSCRWKGENVSTREVEGVLSSLDFLQEVNVYGVPVPGMGSLPDFKHLAPLGMEGGHYKSGAPLGYREVKSYA